MSQTTRVYTCPPYIKWVTDDTSIVIVNEQRNSHHILVEAEAAIWNWMTIPYSYRQMLPLVTTLWSVSLPEAEKRLQHLLQKWQTNGLLNMDPDGTNG